jgi:Flp pilus assembly protein TadD
MANPTSDQLEQISAISPDLSEVNDSEIIGTSETGGAIYNTEIILNFGELKKLFDECVDYNNPLVRHTALVIASRFPGDYSIQQICLIYDYMKNGDSWTNEWSYVQDPRESDYYQSASETLAIGEDSGYVGAGDCDDFAISMAALIEAIGGTTRIIMAYDKSGSHAYTEVYLGQLDDKNNHAKDIISWLKHEYNTNNISVHKDNETSGVWLNLDWGPENSSGIWLFRPGGPFYTAENHIVIRIQNKSELSFPKISKATSPTSHNPLTSTYVKDDWASIGFDLYHEGNYEASVDALSSAIQQNPDNADAWRLKGAALNALGRFEEGINCLNKAIDIDPQSGNTWTLKSFALNHLGRYEESIECANKAIEIDPQDVTAWNNKGFSLLTLDKYADAVECFDRAIGISPNETSSWNNKGAALGKQKKYDEAIKCYDKAIELDPKNVQFWFQKSYILQDLHRTAEAKEAEMEALKLMNSGPLST